MECGFGEIETVDLKPGGAQINVTCENCREYVDLYTQQNFSAELVPFGEPCCAQGLHEGALHQQKSSPLCPDNPAAPPSLQVGPVMCPECPGGHLL
eukprot:1159589-Pelagomonas_calceolata.AAC.6